MVIVEKLNDAVFLLLNAAKKQGTLSYQEFYSVFEASDKEQDKNDTLEAASRALCSPEVAIYSAVLSNKDSHPGMGFYEAYRNLRYADFVQEVGNKRAIELSSQEKLLLANIERERVYRHAELSFTG